MSNSDWKWNTLIKVLFYKATPYFSNNCPSLTPLNHQTHSFGLIWKWLQCILSLEESLFVYLMIYWFICSVSSDIYSSIFCSKQCWVARILNYYMMLLYLCFRKVDLWSPTFTISDTCEKKRYSWCLFILVWLLPLFYHQFGLLIKRQCESEQNKTFGIHHSMELHYSKYHSVKVPLYNTQMLFSDLL